MSTLLVIAFLFFCGSLLGWIIELFYRRFFAPSRKWINPGFLVGPYLPLYGFSLVIMFLLSYIPINFVEEIWLKKLILFILMAICITVIEYVAGLIFIKGMNIKLWDYSNQWGNIKGIICPKFSFFWMCLSAFYYFVIHPRVLKSLYWLADNLSFSFFIGFFYGVFVIDLVYSMQILAKIRKFAIDNNIEVKIEEFKAEINRRNAERKEKHFVLAFKSNGRSLSENLRLYTQKTSSKLSQEILNTMDKLDEFKDEVKENLDQIKDEVKEGFDEMKDSYDDRKKNADRKSQKKS